MTGVETVATGLDPFLRLWPTGQSIIPSLCQVYMYAIMGIYLHIFDRLSFFNGSLDLSGVSHYQTLGTNEGKLSYTY